MPSAPGLGSTDIAACLALGEFWQAVPSTIRVEFTGEKQPFVTGKDLILAVIGEIGVGGATNAVLEFVGDGARALSVDERLAVSNMAVEAGAETGLFPPDDTVADYLGDRESRVQATVPGELASDPDAELRTDARDRPRRARSRSSRCRISRATSFRSRKRPGRRSTRSTSATARTGR